MKRYSKSLNRNVSVSSRYKTVDISSRYTTINVTGGTSESITSEGGYIWCPYVPVMLEPEIIGWEPTPEQIREEREKKLKRIYGN